MELEEAIEKLNYLKTIRDLKDYVKDNNCMLADAIEVALNHLTKQEKMIDKIKSKLEDHIQHCKQEARGSLHNEICYISLKFDESLLNIIKNKVEENL